MTLLRYIHQNPLKAGIVKKVGDYEWSSWSEYTGKVPAAVCLCAINAVYKRITTEDLKELVDTPLDEDVSCLDIDEVVRASIGDRDVRKYLQERYGIADSIKVQELEKEKRNEIIVSCLEIGTGLRQLSRLTGVTYGVINKLNKGR